MNDITHIIFLDFILIQKDVIKAYLLKWHKGVLYAYKKYLNLFKNKIFWKWLQSIQINYSDFYKFLQFYLNRFWSPNSKSGKEKQKKKKKGQDRYIPEYWYRVPEGSRKF